MGKANRYFKSRVVFNNAFKVERPIGTLKMNGVKMRLLHFEYDLLLAVLRYNLSIRVP